MLVEDKAFKIATELAKGIKRFGGTALIVGGWVRDKMLGETPKDIDLEIYGIPQEQLVVYLVEGLKADVDMVGVSFGVIKVTIDGVTLDVSIPRRERKTGVKHGDFDIECDSSMSIKEAASRRDFTINSMAFDPLTGEVHDPFNGAEDLANLVLRPVGVSFGEDALRVLRGMQFIARFGLSYDTETVHRCQALIGDGDNLAKERVWCEFEKLFRKGKKLSNALWLLCDSGWWHVDWLRCVRPVGTSMDQPDVPDSSIIANVSPIRDMDHTLQNPEYHAEGNVLTHTSLVMDAAALISDEDTRLIVGLAALMHDIGKPYTTKEDFSAAGHAEVGAKIAKQLLEQIGAPSLVKAKVVKLVSNHMFNDPTLSARAIRRLANRLAPATIDELAALIDCDRAGRISKNGTTPPSMLTEALREAAIMLNVINDRPKPLVMGRHLIAIGVAPGKDMGVVLDMLYEAQLDGLFDSVEGGVNYYNLQKRKETV